MIYTTCKYAPEELFAGFGEECRRLDPNPASFSCADGCAHPNLCGFAKAVIEAAQAEDVREIVLTDCCDAMRRTYDVLRRQSFDFIGFLPLPHKRGEREIRRFAADLRALADAYAAHSGRTFSRAPALRACAAAAQPEEQAGSPIVTLTGAHGGSLLLEKARQALPGYTVRDDTCSGSRRLTGENLPAGFETDEAFFLWYAGALLHMRPCLRMADTAGRTQAAREQAGAGMIVHTVKFCDYYSFEYAALKDAAEIPLLKIETDTTPQSSGQLKTRLEAFAETLNAQQRGGDRPVTEEKKEIRFAAGIDSGSTSTDAVVMDREGRILGQAILPTGMSASRSAQEALKAALGEAGLGPEDLDAVVATGYGRDALEMQKRTVTEITCHAKGAHYLFPQARTLIDIGGQDSKVIRVDETGMVENFIMNDKCAAGTGRFLEMQARALGLTMEEMSRMGLTWRSEVEISNMCTVFAESEVVSLVARDTPLPDIIHGLNRSVAAKTVSLIRRGRGEPGYAMTGGVSRNAGVVSCLSQALGAPVEVSELSQLCGAIGAALIALGR